MPPPKRLFHENRGRFFTMRSEPGLNELTDADSFMFIFIAKYPTTFENRRSSGFWLSRGYLVTEFKFQSRRCGPYQWQSKIGNPLTRHGFVSPSDMNGRGWIHFGSNRSRIQRKNVPLIRYLGIVQGNFGGKDMAIRRSNV